MSNPNQNRGFLCQSWQEILVKAGEEHHMTTATVFSEWTGTKGTRSTGMEEDFGEVCQRMESRCISFRLPEVEITPHLVKKAIEFVIKEVGEDAEYQDLTVRELMELFLG